MNRRRTTIDMIAAHAGVSIATVSNVLNNKGRFSNDVKNRVQLAVEELRFTPSGLIRSLQNGKTNVLGVRTWPYWQTFSASINMELLSGIADGLTEAGFDMLYYMDFPARKHKDRALMFMDGRVDGLVVAANLFPAEELQVLADSHLPTVMLYAPNVPDGLGAICVDNHGGITSAVNHLAELGHICIGFVGAPVSADLNERAVAFAAAVSAKGIGCGVAVYPETYEFDADAVVQQVIESRPRVTAIVAGDDYHAISLIAAFRRLGVRVPEDLSIIGFDDAPSAAASANLTNIRQPAREIGRLSVQFAVALGSGTPFNECKRTMSVELVVRGTTCPPRPR